MKRVLQFQQINIALLMTLMCLFAHNRTAFGVDPLCYEPSMVVKLYFDQKNSTQIIAKGNTVTYRLNDKEVAVLKDGNLATNYPDQIFHLENTQIGLKLRYTEGEKLDIRGKWSARITEPGRKSHSSGYSESVNIVKPAYRMIDTAPVTATTKDKQVLLPFIYEVTDGKACSEFNASKMSLFKTNSSGSYTIATRLSTDVGFSQIFLKEYTGRLVVHSQSSGYIWIVRPVPTDSAIYRLEIMFDQERSLAGNIELTVTDADTTTTTTTSQPVPHPVPAFQLRLAVVLHTNSKTDSTRASDSFRQALRSLTSSVADYQSYDIIPLIRSGPCTPAMVNRQIIEVWMKQYQEQTLTTDAIRGFVVNDCDEACYVYSAFATSLKTPAISYGCTSDVYSTDPEHSTLKRTLPALSRLADAFYQLMKHFHWKHLAVLSTLTMKMESAALAFNEYLSGKEFTIFRYRVNTLSSEYRSSPKSTMAAAFEEVKERYRIVLLLMEPKAVVEFLSAVRPRYDTQKFVFLTINNQIETDHYFSDLRSGEIVKLQEGVISASIQTRDRLKSKRQISSNNNAEYPWAGYMYDALQILVRALHTEFTKGPSVNFNNSNAVSYTSTGINDEKANYRFQMIQSGRVLDISKYFMVGSSNIPTIDFSQTSKIEWPDKVVPSDVPCENCDEDGSKSREESFSEGVGGILTYIFITAALLCLVLIVIFMIRRQMRYNDAVHTLPDWIIPWSELEISEPELHSSTSTISTTTESVVHLNADGGMQAFISNAVYKGNVVAIKELNCSQIDVSRKENIIDIAEIRSLDHENINPFIGVCVKAPHVAIVWLYAARGSIDDLLRTNSHCLRNFDLLSSLLLDIAHGMAYLHRSVIGSHGRLKSTNCVVDERWTCRITDYGMGHIRNCSTSSTPKKDETEEDYNSDQLWTAPELLRMKYRPLYGTKKGDVYSFGIILQEMLLMDVPYALNMEINYNLTAKDIIAKIRDMERDTDPYRPILPIDSCFDSQWVILTKTCWHENPSERPTFHHIRDEIIRLANFEEMDFVDKTLLMLEEYNVNLQGLVQRRAEKLQMEKRKTEDLDYSLIPREMAKMLEYGEDPVPLIFDSVTVYYSVVHHQIADVPGESTPHKVILLMNTICNSFDTITDQYDVQKVDSIGDTYIVAGGLNGNRKTGHHYAWQTATLALHLLTAVTTLRLPDISNNYIKIKIGLHTGSVLAGVIGTNRLRYSILGETLQIATRIQEEGEENRIIISEATEHLLRPSGNFHLESRGLSEVIKGKTMETFFLLDKTGFVLKSEEVIAAAYLPRSPYFAARDRRPNPFSSGKPILSPAVTVLIPETLASPPNIPDIPPPSIPIVPIVEEIPSDEVHPSPSGVSEHLNLLDQELDQELVQPKISKARPSTKKHKRKPSKVTSEKHTQERTQSLPSSASPQKEQRESSPSRRLRHTVVETPEGFIYTLTSNVQQMEDSKRSSSGN